MIIGAKADKCADGKFEEVVIELSRRAELVNDVYVQKIGNDIDVLPVHNTGKDSSRCGIDDLLIATGRLLNSAKYLGLKMPIRYDEVENRVKQFCNRIKFKKDEKLSVVETARRKRMGFQATITDAYTYTPVLDEAEFCSMLCKDVNEGEALALLRFLHLRGVVMHRPLSGDVFLDPKWVVNEVVNHAFLLNPKQNGVVTREQLEKNWMDFEDEVRRKEQIICK